ncbi:hypothetical protein HK101_000428, partial [Irineochytrium annulatum]
LVDRLLQLGYRVRVLDNFVSGSILHLPLQHSHLEVRHGDVMNARQLGDAMRDADFIFHLAGSGKSSTSSLSSHGVKWNRDVNVVGTRNVLELARIHGIKKIVFASVASLYGTNMLPHAETDMPMFLNPHAASKYEGEIQMKLFNDIYNIPTVSVRIFNPYGPRQKSSGANAELIGRFIRQATLDAPLTIEGAGDALLDFTHVLDVVDGLILAQQVDGVRGEVLNIGTGVATTVNDAAQLVAHRHVHVTRLEPVEPSVANTCKMKTALGFVPKRDLKVEVPKALREAMAGEVYQQKWFDREKSLVTPWLVREYNYTAFPWKGRQNDLVDLIGSLPSKERSGSQYIGLVQMNSTTPTALMLNYIYSMVKMGGVHAYVVAAKDSALQQCMNLNLPCWNVTDIDVVTRSRLILEILKTDNHVVAGDSSLKMFDSADVILNRPHANEQDVQTFNIVVKASKRTVNMFEIMSLAMAQTTTKVDERGVLMRLHNKQWKLCDINADCRRISEDDVSSLVLYFHTMSCEIVPQPDDQARCRPGQLFLPVCGTVDQVTRQTRVHNPAAMYVSRCSDDDWQCDPRMIVPRHWYESKSFEPHFCKDTVVHLLDVVQPKPKKSSAYQFDKEYASKLEAYESFDVKVEGNSFSLSEARCEAVFPELFHEIDRALEYFKTKNITVTRRYLDDYPLNPGLGKSRGFIYQGQLYVTYVDQPWRSRNQATFHQIHRALVSNPATDDPIPDVEFMFCASDIPCKGLWAYTRRRSEQDYWLIPDYGFFSWPEPMMHGIMWNRQFIEHTEPKWEAKEQKLIWRGAAQNQKPRQNFLDFSKNQTWSDVTELDWGDHHHRQHVYKSMPDHCKYQFTGHTEGVSHSGRLKYLLHCKSVVVAPNPMEWLEYFYHLLKDDSHGPEHQNFIGVDPMFENIKDVMKNYTAKPDVVKRIAENNVRTFRDRYLTPAAEACYWRRLLRSWKKVMDPDFKPNPFHRTVGTADPAGAFESFALLNTLHFFPN